MKNFRASFRMVFLWVAFLGCWSVLGTANALCRDGKIPLDEEFRRSKIVAVATAISETPVAEASDPDGVTAIRYDFTAKKFFKGNSQQFSVWIDNTSSRVVFEPGQEYLVFVQPNAGRPFVDSCGGSALAKNSGAIIERLKAYGGRAQNLK